MTALRTLDQQRAAFAWDQVHGLESGWQEYRDLVRKLPSMVQTNGLGPALAFLIVQKGTKYQLYEHLQEWLCVKAPRPVYPASPSAGTRDQRLMSLLNQRDSLALRRATVEVQALAVWLKRFAEARETAALASGAASPEEGASVPGAQT